MRCVHEAQLHPESSFVTLTYSNDQLPSGWTLVPEDLKLFHRRVNDHFGGLRYFSAGEYDNGSATTPGIRLSGGGRPHYHCLLFGIGFRDRVHHRKSPSGEDVYRSPTLERLWPYGFSSLGEVTFQSAAYVARYVMKKEYGKDAGAARSYLDVTTGELCYRAHEFLRMSLKPGIGMKWLELYWRDVYPSGQVVIDGHEVKVPRAYDKWYAAKNPEAFAQLQARRQVLADSHFEDNGPARLRVKEQVLDAKLSLLKRG